MNSAEQIKEQWEILKEDVKKLTDRHITIVAVTKYYPAEIYQRCLEAGISEIGENRIQELIEKNELMSEERKRLKIHFIGPLQKNKVKFLSGNADYLDTLTSEDTIKVVNARWGIPGEGQAETPQKLPVLLQVNCTDEVQKAGLHISNFNKIIEIARLCIESPKIELEGIMTMGPTPMGNYDFPDKKYTDDTRNAFLKAVEIKSQMENELEMNLPRLSMGMSHDYKLAVECGSTEIRVGSMLFG